ncbi:MAG TPA: DUF1707 domain-containing protein [Nakamurella sp.]
MTQPESSDTLRIGDREREQAVALLQDAVGGGYLDLQEFEDRSRTVYAAKTRGHLRAALADLPTAIHLFPPAVPTPTTVNPNILDIDWTTMRRRGDWQVPAYLVISGSMGTADLDLRDAAIPPGGCVIEVQASWSTVKLKLGPSAAIRTDGFAGGSMSSMKDRAGPPTTPGGPTIDVRGRANWTTVVVRRSS